MLEQQLQRVFQVVESLQDEVRMLKGQSADNQTTAPLSNLGAIAADDEIQEIEDRLEETEELVSEIDERIGSRAVVNAYDALEFRLSNEVSIRQHVCLEVSPLHPQRWAVLRA